MEGVVTRTEKQEEKGCEREDENHFRVEESLNDEESEGELPGDLIRTEEIHEDVPSHEPSGVETKSSNQRNVASLFCERLILRKTLVFFWCFLCIRFFLVDPLFFNASF